ncbi:MAG: tRNA guanosine(34) transglycosylase Tgt [Proteobacteria bacterium]|nr:MAG: tRNA guanosine(34) transglycosylase Tgt [Pseudomonadota bacterium]
MFTLHKTDDKTNARLGTLDLHHGQVQTPIFMPVGTVGSVKTMVPEDLHGMGAEIILGNTYHLYIRPGLEIIREFGGLHGFVNWQKPILTDSGGFQIFSLANQRKIDETGAHFQSHLDGKHIHLTPELAVEIQETLGADIHMVLDECTAGTATYDEAKRSMRRSMRWAARSRAARTKMELAQFGIVQGCMFEDLRSESIESLTAMDFEGYSIGGLSVGESKEDMRRITKHCCDRLPQEKPRYLMGVGTPLDLIESIAAGVDMFDCVMPTRNGRNGTLFTSKGRVNIKNTRYRMDKGPLDENCNCYTCQNFSLSYLRHLFMAKEYTGQRLLTLHNLTYYLNFIREIRAAIADGTFHDLLTHHQGLWQS